MIFTIGFSLRFSVFSVTATKIIEVEPQALRIAIEENRKGSGKESPETQIDKERGSGEGFKQEITRKCDEDSRTIVEVHRADEIA